MSRLDEPLLTWRECVLSDYDSPEGVVVALPHSADRLDIGLAIHQTIWGGECDPGPGDATIRKAWARLLTLREQWKWEYEVAGIIPTGDPPADWWPDEGTPVWMEDPHGEEVWIAEWSV